MVERVLAVATRITAASSALAAIVNIIYGDYIAAIACAMVAMALGMLNAPS